VESEIGAFTSALDAASPSLLSIANIADLGGGALTSNLMPHLDGQMQEGWMDGGSGTQQQDSSFLQKEDWAAADAANNQYDMLVTQSASEAGQTYGLAADLLTANGKQLQSTSWSSSSPHGCYSGSGCETWLTNENNQALQLGPGTGGSTTSCFSTASQCFKQTVGSTTVYERAFANGLVLMNPSQSTASNVSLGRTYSGYNAAPCTSSSSCSTGTVTDVSGVTSLSLGPDGAAILLKS
jgi:hypothetical protein